MPIAREGCILRQFWHESPPLVTMAFGLALMLLWLRASSSALSYLVLDAGVVVFLAGVILGNPVGHVA